MAESKEGDRGCFEGVGDREHSRLVQWDIGDRPVI
jgi:hypothetical protein